MSPFFRFFFFFCSPFIDCSISIDVLSPPFWVIFTPGHSGLNVGQLIAPPPLPRLSNGVGPRARNLGVSTPYLLPPPRLFLVAEAAHRGTVSPLFLLHSGRRPPCDCFCFFLLVYESLPFHPPPLSFSLALTWASESTASSPSLPGPLFVGGEGSWSSFHLL